MHRAILESFSALCWSVATPLAYKALKAVERGDFGWLIRQRVNPADYLCPHMYLGDAQVVAFFSKFKDVKIPGLDRKAAALESFWAGEQQCYRSNEHLSPLLEDISYYGEGIKSFIQTWRLVVLKCIGKTPNYEALSDARFGPGSTFANVGDRILLADKLTSNYTVTRQAVTWLPFLEQSAWLRSQVPEVIATYIGSGHREYSSPEDCYKKQLFSEVRGNRFTTVDKNAKTDRGISIEASANVSLQLAMGREISLKLKRSFGWDKRTAQGYHRNLARIGSLTGAVATIDLSNASDTVSRNLVKLLLPPAWYRLLDDLRSHHTLVGSNWVKLEKFSSMGNGFTFELETLIFRTLIETCRIVSHDVNNTMAPGVDYSVFGDDIICPTGVSRFVVASLTFFGFKTNVEKTFLQGPFRESCGGDYFHGLDVRPHHVREDCELPSQLIALANGVRRFRVRYSKTGWWYSPRTVHIWHAVLNHIPRLIRECRGPDILGDLVINDDPEAWLPRTKTRNSVRYIRVWRPVVNDLVSWDHYRPAVVLACALYGVPSGTPPTDPWADNSESWRRSGVVPRLSGSYVRGFRFGRVAYS